MTCREVVHNPFATRSTRPGQLAWWSVTESPAGLLDRLDQLGGRGVLCGPHGSGKSTLLWQLLAEGRTRGWTVRHLRLRSRVDVVVAAAALLGAGDDQQLLCIDSWETLGWAGRLLAQLAWRRRGRLIITTHHASSSGGLPILLRTQPTPACFRSLVADLLARSSGHEIDFEPQLLEAIFWRHEGNLREAFFELYDRFEAAVRSPQAA